MKYFTCLILFLLILIHLLYFNWILSIPDMRSVNVCRNNIPLYLFKKKTIVTTGVSFNNLQHSRTNEDEISVLIRFQIATPSKLHIDILVRFLCKKYLPGVVDGSMLLVTFKLSPPGVIVSASIFVYFLFSSKLKTLGINCSFQKKISWNSHLFMGYRLHESFFCICLPIIGGKLLQKCYRYDNSDFKLLL